MMLTMSLSFIQCIFDDEFLNYKLKKIYNFNFKFLLWEKNDYMGNIDKKLFNDDIKTINKL